VKVQLHVTNKFETFEGLRGRVSPESELSGLPHPTVLIGAQALMNLPTSSTVIDAGHVERGFFPKYLFVMSSQPAEPQETLAKCTLCQLWQLGCDELVLEVTIR